MSSELKNQFIELREAVNQSAELTKNQLESINRNNPLSVLIPLAISLIIVYRLQIALYWVSASFFIMLLWVVYSFISSFISSKKSSETETVKSNIETTIQPTKKQIYHFADAIIINVLNFSKATAIIYGISFFILLGILQGWIDVQKEVSLYLPLLTTAIYMLLLVMITILKPDIKEGFYEVYKLREAIRSNSEREDSSTALDIAKIVPSTFFGLCVVLVVLISVLVNLILPIIALVQTINLIDNWLFFILVALLQFVSIMLISSYYSNMTANKFLTNSLTDYADLNYQINNILLSNKCDREVYEKLKKLYLTAKPFDIVVEDLIQLLPFYSIVPNRTYFGFYAENKQDEK